MENLKVGNMEIAIPNLLLMIGGLLMIIMVFLAWVKVTVDGGWLGSDSEVVSGLDLILGKHDGDTIEDLSFIAKMPLLMLLTGIAALVLGALPMFGVDNNGIKIAGAVVAILAVIFGLLFLIMGASENLFTGDAKDAYKEAIKAGWVKMSLQFGSIAGFIAAIIAAVGGVLNVLPVLKK